jgi:hypothetical protein
MKLLFCVLGMLFSVTTIVSAQTAGGLRFLDVGSDPLSLSLSETKTAVLLGAPSIFANPANLAMESSSSLSATHTFWIAGTRNIQASVNIRRNENAFAFGVYTSLIDDLEARNVPGESNGSFSWQYYAFAGSLARSFGPLSVGVTGMYLYEQVFLVSAKGYAVNAGISGKLLDDRIRLATSLNSIGKMEPLNASRSEVPGRFKIGAELQALQFSVPGSTEVPVLISVAADFVKPVELIDQEQSPFFEEENGFASLNSDSWVNAAIRADIADLLNLRFGFTTAETSRPFSVGAGVRRFGVEADLAFVPFNDGFGSAFSLGLRYGFN